jgi:hypothetical protein
MKEKPKFNTYQDAETFYQNSGVFEWKWFKGFDEKELINFLFNKSDGIKTFEELLKEFLTQHEQLVSDYFSQIMGKD